jgi:hypothetical protein
MPIDKPAPLRELAPSLPIRKEIAVGTPAAMIASYAALLLASKFAIPLEVAGAGVGLLVQGVTTLISYFARGGRRGESTAELAHKRIDEIEVATGMFRTMKDPDQ